MAEKTSTAPSSGKATATIAHIMTSVSRGGLELYVRDLIGKLQAARVKQIVVCDENSFIVDYLRSQQIAIEYLQRGSRYSIRRMLRLREIHKKNGITIWHSHQRDDMVLVALAFFFTKIRHIFSLYMGFARKKDFLHRLIYARLEKLVTTSQVMNALAHERLPVRADQISLIRYGRETVAFKVSQAKIRAVRKSLGLQRGQKLVLSLCRIDPMKGVYEFAEAAQCMDGKARGKFVFVQIGERTVSNFDAAKNPVYHEESNVAYEYLTLQTGHTKGCRFRLMPFQKEYIPYLAAADYFVLASYDEMYSLSLIDAMLARAFVVGTNNGGTVEQLADGRGLLVTAKNASAIAAALLYAEGNSAFRKKSCDAAYRWAMREHSWRSIVPEWLEIYRNGSSDRRGTLHTRRHL